MKTEQITIGGIERQYGNPIPLLVQLACGFESQIRIADEKMTLNAKSIMGMMIFQPVSGKKVTIQADGSDEEKAAATIQKFLEGGSIQQ